MYQKKTKNVIRHKIIKNRAKVKTFIGGIKNILIMGQKFKQQNAIAVMLVYHFVLIDAIDLIVIQKWNSIYRLNADLDMFVRTMDYRIAEGKYNTPSLDAVFIKKSGVCALPCFKNASRTHNRGNTS